MFICSITSIHIILFFRNIFATALSHACLGFYRFLFPCVFSLVSHSPCLISIIVVVLVQWTPESSQFLGLSWYLWFWYSVPVDNTSDSFRMMIKLYLAFCLIKYLRFTAKNSDRSEHRFRYFKFSVIFWDCCSLQI